MSSIDQTKIAKEFYKAHVEKAENLPISDVRLSLPSMEEMHKAIKDLAKESTAPDKETPDWMEADIRRGMEWMYKRLTGSEA